MHKGPAGPFANRNLALDDLLFSVHLHNHHCPSGRAAKAHTDVKNLQEHTGICIPYVKSD